MSDELGTCGRGPLGTSTNCPVPDAGTLNRTQNRPSVPQGKQGSSPLSSDSRPTTGVTDPRKKQSHPVSLYDEGESGTFDKLQREIKGLGIGYKIGGTKELKNEPDAVYDPVNNEVRISKEGYEKYQKGDAEQLKRTIVHELVHARQYKELLGGEKDPNRRKQLIDKKVLSQKEEEYVKTMWERELDAEKAAWQASTESIGNFAKNRGNSFSSNTAQTVIDDALRDFAKETKAEYESDFRATYRETLRKSRLTRP